MARAAGRHVRGVHPGALARLALLAAVSALLAAAWRAARRYRRYEVTGQSMLPALRHGDWVIVDTSAYRRTPPRPREVAMAMDPRNPARTLVKRVERVEPGGAVWLLGDNPPASTDSRTLAAFASRLLVGRVRWRYWPPPLGAIR